MGQNQIWVLLALIAGFFLGASRVWLERSPSSSDADLISQADRLVAKSESDWYSIHEIAGLVHPPNASRKMLWEEYPTGQFEMRTNNLGLRNDLATSRQKAPGTKRMLILGDSHIDGVVSNHESVAGQLQQKWPGWEILNGGVGHSNPRHYMGSAIKHAALNCDAMVVVIYAGNDFGELVRDVLPKRVPFRPDGYYEKLERAHQSLPPSIDQGLNQTFYFHQYPNLQSLATDLALHYLLEIQDFAGKNNFSVFFVLLPTKLDVEWDFSPPAIETVLKRLKLSKEEILKQQSGLREELIRKAAIRGLKIEDLTEDFLQNSVEKFWKQDFHLNVAGHQALAEAIEKRWGAKLRAER